MIKIGLTGNIASGKTFSENIFKSYGINVISADDIVHDLLKNDKNVIKKVTNIFPKADIFENNLLSRKKIAKIVFNSKDLRKKLEKILHKEVIEKINDFFEKNKNENTAIASVPLLFEAKLQNMFDVIIFIQANENIRLKRLMNRNNYSKEFAKKIMDAQMNEDLKLPLSNFIIENNQDEAYLKKQIHEIIKNLNIL
ncbi:MAG: dephospho-CoA kinase [Candidatus Melainabacteria bacterium LEY3_CP_29_8]|nr:MAG: dephospho-CoA kinase [Candidatus Melainabacteria bacterium LEY3_CP_29_8]